MELGLLAQVVSWGIKVLDIFKLNKIVRFGSVKAKVQNPLC